MVKFMKKILILMILFLAGGCTYNEEIKGEITEIKYNDLIIMEEDYDKIKSLINTSFSSNKPDDKFTDTLVIKTEEELYSYKLSDNYISINNHYSKNTSLNKYLEELEAKYKDPDFYTIEYTKNIESNDIISLDKTSNYIVIDFKSEVKEFKINQIESENDKYTDIDLLYNEDEISDKIIIRKTINYSNPDIRISFTNKYNYTVSIILTYDKEGNVAFETTYEQE